MYSHLLKRTVFTFHEYSIVPLREKDILPIKEWRNSQIGVLRQKQELTKEDQEQYYQNVVKQTFNHPAPKQILFSYLIGNECIGYGGITNIDWESERAELSFLLNNKHVIVESIYEKVFSIFITLIKQVVFKDLQFNRIFTETYDNRPHHISILEKNGFEFEGRMRQHVQINGKFVDSLLHGILKEEYENRK
jgi:RimJ/RimL family protein N-acetyltransferase